jgi:peptide/nickel transport system substrate-binding protein
MGFQAEPKDFLVDPGRGEGQLMGLVQPLSLVAYDGRSYLPDLVTQLPSQEDGTWQVFPDGRMQVTWKLRPNVKWHDGEPFTSEDLLLGFQYAMSPGSLLVSQWRQAAESASTPDATTFVMQFHQPYARVIEGDIRPLPRHILGSIFDAGDIERFNTQAYFTTEMVGLGPYRLVNWQQGSSMELARFDDYFRGRPKLDGVVAHFYPDANALLANVFAGELDMVLPNILQVEQYDAIKQAFQGTDNGVYYHNPGQFQYVQAQFRPDVVRPKALLDPRVRQAMYRGLDRHSLSEVMTKGQGPVADSWIPPDDPRRANVFKDAIPQYDYDPARAKRDLEAIGFRMGSDGVYLTPDGERFDMALWKTPIPTWDLLTGSIRASWQQIGAEIDPAVIPPQTSGNPAYRASFPSWDMSLIGWTNHETNLRSTRPRPGVSWDNGGGRPGYVNPKLDALIDRLNVTIPEAARNDIHAQILQEQMTDLPRLYMWWDVFVVTISGRVTGVKAPYFQPYYGWDEFDWDIK